MNKKKAIALSLIPLLLLSLFLTITNHGFFFLNKATEPSSYSLNINTSKNNNPTLDKYGYYYDFDVVTDRGTSLAFREREIRFDDNTCWGYSNYINGTLMNMVPISGMTDITVTYSEIESDYDTYVNVKYGWSCGYNNGLTKYEESLVSGESFTFDGKQPSYFVLLFRYAKIESISIHFSCVEVLPSYEDEDHYELVTSMDDVNSTDIYTIASTIDGSGYAMSTDKRTDATNDNYRVTIGVRPVNNQIAYDSGVLQLKFSDAGDNQYNIQTQNYLYGDGYFYSDTNKNTIWVKSDQMTNYDLAIDSDHKLQMTFTYTSSGKQYTRKLYFYSGTTTQFSMYTSPHDDVYLYKLVESNDVVKTLSYSNLTAMSKSYASGNYGKLATGGTNYEYYRTVRASSNSTGYAFKMVSPNFYYSDHGYPSSFYNLSNSPIYGIKSISVTYKADSGIKVALAADYGDETINTLASHTSYATETISTSGKNFFKLMTNGSDAYIVDISITYKDRTTSYESTRTYTGNRKAFTVYSGSYTPGVTTKTMYISETETKTYTYYTYNYVNSHPEVKNDAAMIDPIDVCNYFEAFGCAPANYGQTNFSTTFRDGVAVPSKAQVSSLFGNLARCMSKYSRTDGYATHVPFNNASGSSTPVYYEFDIDTDGSYTVNSRQVGRVVAWDYGFSCYSSVSDYLPVCVYTDDHYATFQEYNNMGGFSPRFDSERNITGYVHTPLTTIS